MENSFSIPILLKTKKMQKSKFLLGLSLIFIIQLTFIKASNAAIEVTEDDNKNEDSARFLSFSTIQILNKTTAKNSILKVKTGEEVIFEKLKITAYKCWQASLDQRPESKILLEVSEKKPATNDRTEIEKRIFYGWIFASSPSISGLQHPVYDIVALGCKNK